MSTSVRLLIVDDFAADVMIYYRYILSSRIQNLSDMNCEILTAETGNEGLEMYTSENPDCVLVDYSLPDMTGLEFLEEVQEQEKCVLRPIILATGYEDPAIHNLAMEKGVSGCYIKGRDGSERLISLIEQIMAGRLKLT